MIDTAIEADDLEVKKEAMVNMVNAKGSPDCTSQQIAYLSDWRMFRIAVSSLVP